MPGTGVLGARKVNDLDCLGVADDRVERQYVGKHIQDLTCKEHPPPSPSQPLFSQCVIPVMGVSVYDTDLTRSQSHYNFNFVP